MALLATAFIKFYEHEGDEWRMYYRGSDDTVNALGVDPMTYFKHKSLVDMKYTNSLNIII